MIAGPPAVVRDAQARAERAGFAMFCDDRAGELLAVLAAAVPRGGRIFGARDGVGAGLAWLVHGLSERTDVDVVSAEADQHVAAIAAEIEWPPFVQLVVADGLSAVQTSGQFDLVFADAPAGKCTAWNTPSRPFALQVTSSSTTWIPRNGSTMSIEPG